MNMNKLGYIFLFFLASISCDSENKKIEQSIYGIGSFKKLELYPINDYIMRIGMETFKLKCASCHTMEYKNSGPDLSDLLARRQPEWVMSYLLNHQEMLEKDSITIRINQKFETNCVVNLTDENEAFAILEYVRMYQIWLHEFNAK